MLRTLTYRILSAADGQTILHYLKSLGYSGPILVHLKKTDHGVLLNGVWVHMNETLHTGDLLFLHFRHLHFSAADSPRDLLRGRRSSGD